MTNDFIRWRLKKLSLSLGSEQAMGDEEASPARLTPATPAAIALSMFLE